MKMNAECGFTFGELFRTWLTGPDFRLSCEGEAEPFF